MMNQSRRKILGNLAGLCLFYPLIACRNGNLFMKKEIVLDVVLYNYSDIVIYDIYLNGIDLGLANAHDGGTGIVTGVTIPFGPQTLTWRDAGSGKSFSIKNSLALSPEQILSNTESLGVHIYPDNTAEFTFSQYMPERTNRGDKSIEDAKKNG